MKSFIQWSSKYTGMIIDGVGIGSFDTLEEAKNKCIDRLKNTKKLTFSIQCVGSIPGLKIGISFLRGRFFQKNWN